MKIELEILVACELTNGGGNDLCHAQKAIGMWRLGVSGIEQHLGDSVAIDAVVVVVAVGELVAHLGDGGE